MAHNKFIKKDGEVLLDLTSDTIASDKLMSGVTAHNRSGEAINGTFTIDNELTAQDNLIAQIQTALQGKAAGGSTEDLDSIISELETKAATLNTTLANKAAGGGGSFEAHNVSFNNTPEPDAMIYYTNANGEYCFKALAGNDTYSMAKGTIFATINLLADGYNFNPPCVLLGGSSMCAAYLAINAQAGGMD